MFVMQGKILNSSEDLGSEATKKTDVKTALYIKKSHLNIDIKEVEASTRERSKFLELALTNFGKTLARSEEGRHDIIVFRFISLWFDNADSDSVNGLVEGLVANIPSCKFVGLLYQLAARMSDQVGGGFIQVQECSKIWPLGCVSWGV